MKKLIIIILFTAFLFPSVSLAMDGNELLKAFQQAIKVLDESNTNIDFYTVGMTLGLIGGIRDTMDLYCPFITESNIKQKLCVIDQKTTTGKLVRIVLNFLEDHPEKLHETDTRLITSAILKGF